jgi:hypothetical protein
MAFLAKFFSEEFIKFVVEVLEKIGLFVTHGTVDVNVLDVGIFENLFEKSGFTGGSRAVDEEVHSSLEESGEGIFFRDHFEMVDNNGYELKWNGALN